VRGSNRWGREKSDRPRRGRWSQAEIARLRELYGLRDDEAIAKDLNRPVASVRKMAEQVFPETKRTGPWTASEVQELKKYLGATSAQVIARILGRPEEEVRSQILGLGRIQRDEEWSQEDTAEFKRLYGTRTNKHLALIFGRSEAQIREFAEVLCLAKDKAFLRKLTDRPPTRMPRWTPEEIERLRETYPIHSNLEIAQELNRSVKSVVSKAHILGLKKDRARLQEMGRENVSLRYGKEREDEASGDSTTSQSDTGDEPPLQQSEGS
jgi:hypothetical protein